MENIETIELGDLSESAPKIVLNDASIQSLPSVNFGPGADLLMNDKKTINTGGMESDIDLGDLETLESELTGESSSSTKNISVNSGSNSSFHEKKSSLFSGGDDGGLKINILDSISESNAPTADEPVRNQETKPSAPVEKTWDGFATFNDIPIGAETTKAPQMTKEEMLREKFSVLKKLEDLERKGAELTKKYTMESSLAEMQGEYQTLISEKEKSNSVKFQGRMLMAAITGLEFLNNKFDPFDLKLDGWAEQINEGIDDYDEIFSELHDKYKSKAKLAPELKMLFQLGGGAIMLHMTNTMFKTSMPGMDDIMRDNPDLMDQFTRAAVDKMGDDNPGLSGFMNNLMQPDVPTPRGPPPPEAVRTQGPFSQEPPRREAEVNISNRPDLSYGRGAPQDGISINESFLNTNEVTKQEKSQRPEMDGPQDINDLLSGLKNKIEEPQERSGILKKSDSKEKKRRNGSAKNTISLNI